MCRGAENFPPSTFVIPEPLALILAYLFQGNRFSREHKTLLFARASSKLHLRGSYIRSVIRLGYKSVLYIMYPYIGAVETAKLQIRNRGVP